MYSNNKILINHRDDDCQNQLHIKTDTAYNILVAIDEGAHVFEIGVNVPSDLYFEMGDYFTYRVDKIGIFYILNFKTQRKITLCFRKSLICINSTG